MKAFLWCIFIVGFFDAINMIARIYYKKWTNKYTYHVIIGIWAGFLLWQMN